MTERLKQLRKAIMVAEDAYARALAEEYPPGSWIVYRHGHYLVAAEVTDHSGDRVRVCGDSGREYWISGYRIDGFCA